MFSAIAISRGGGDAKIAVLGSLEGTEAAKQARGTL